MTLKIVCLHFAASFLRCSLYKDLILKLFAFIPVNNCCLFNFTKSFSINASYFITSVEKDLY